MKVSDKYINVNIIWKWQTVQMIRELGYKKMQKYEMYFSQKPCSCQKSLFICQQKSAGWCKIRLLADFCWQINRDILKQVTQKEYTLFIYNYVTQKTLLNNKILIWSINYSLINKPKVLHFTDLINLTCCYIVLLKWILVYVWLLAGAETRG